MFVGVGVGRAWGSVGYIQEHSPNQKVGGHSFHAVAHDAIRLRCACAVRRGARDYGCGTCHYRGATSSCSLVTLPLTSSATFVESCTIISTPYITLLPLPHAFHIPGFETPPGSGRFTGERRSPIIKNLKYRKGARQPSGYTFVG